MARVRVDDQQCVREILGQVERVHSWDHDVVAAVHDENGLLDLTEAREAIAVRCGPCLNRSQLGTGNLIAAGRLAILASRPEPFKKARPAAWLVSVEAKKSLSTASPKDWLSFTRASMACTSDENGAKPSPPSGAVPARIIFRTRLGRSSAICCATNPPRRSLVSQRWSARAGRQTLERDGTSRQRCRAFARPSVRYRRCQTG